MPGTHAGKAHLHDFLYRTDENESIVETMPFDPNETAEAQQLPFDMEGQGSEAYQIAGLMPEDDMLLKSLLKGEIGPLTDPRIRKAIDDLQKEKYGYNRGRA